jgi:hypothetical protein
LAGNAGKEFTYSRTHRLSSSPMDTLPAFVRQRTELQAQ